MPLSNTELVSIVNAEINQGYNSTDGGGETMQEIAHALDYYLGEPLGNEEEGSSSVISRDVKDVIETILPSLIKIFVSTDRAVEFLPFGPEDEESAKQETDIVNYVFYKENPGFFIVYEWFKDALQSKNGVVKVWWDETETSTKEEYENQSDESLQQLLADPELEPVEHEEKIVDGVSKHDIVFRRNRTEGRARVEVIPMEEFIISKDANSIFPDKARFTCHRAHKTRSQLIAEGFPRELVETLGTSTDESDTDSISIARNQQDDDTFGEEAKDQSLKEIEVFECYMNVDVDGDGIAELRQITLAGNEILVNEEIEENPFVAITPIILTHKFFGFSVADDTMDIQLIKSTLMRGILNNMYEANNRTKYYQSGMVNLDDLLVSRPNRVVETMGPPGQVIQEAPPGQLPPQVFDVLTMMDKMRKERTGVGDESFGLDANVLAHGKTGVIDQAFNAARARPELIARVFAEVGFKPLFLKLHGLLQRHQDKEKVIKIRNTWVPVDPTEWKTRKDMTVNVGLGTGNKDKEINSLLTVLGIQRELLPTGRGVTEANVYNTLEKLTEAAGLGDASIYFTDPATQPPPQPQPDPQMEILRLQQQIEAQKAQTDAENARTKRVQAEQDFMVEQAKLDLKNKEIDLTDERDRTKLELEYRRDVPGAAV